MFSERSVLFDFSRVLLFPREATYTGTLNGLYKLHKDGPDFKFFHHFVLNEELLAFIPQHYSRDRCSIFTSDIIQDDTAVRSIIDPLFANVFSAKALGLGKKDPSAYCQVAGLLRQHLSQILYVDDLEDNCRAAAEAGLTAHCYRSNTALFRVLEEWGSDRHPTLRQKRILAGRSSKDDFGEIASHYRQYTSQAATKWFGLMQLSQLLDTAGAERVLDYGCGTGEFASYLQSRGKTVTGVDISEKMIEAAREAHPLVDFLHISGCAGLSEFVTAPFEAVTATWVDCVIADRDELAGAINQISRVLKPGAIFLLMNSNWEDGNGIDFASIRLNHRSDLKTGDPVTITIKSSPPIDIPNWYWATSDLVSLLQSAGFEDVEVRKPLAPQDDPSLIVEKRIPPVRIISGRKAR